MAGCAKKKTMEGYVESTTVGVVPKTGAELKSKLKAMGYKGCTKIREYYLELLDEEEIASLTKKEIRDMDIGEIRHILRRLCVMQTVITGKGMEELAELLYGYKGTITQEGLVEKIKTEGIGILWNLTFVRIVSLYRQMSHDPGPIKKG